MLVTSWAVVLLRSLFLFSAVSTLLVLFVSFVPLSTMFFPLYSGFVEVLAAAAWELILAGRRLFFLFSACFSVVFPLFVYVFPSVLSSMSRSPSSVYAPDLPYSYSFSSLDLLTVSFFFFFFFLSFSPFVSCLFRSPSFIVFLWLL
jgi:hypothetical protein